MTGSQHTCPRCGIKRHVRDAEAVCRDCRIVTAMNQPEPNPLIGSWKLRRGVWRWQGAKPRAGSLSLIDQPRKKPEPKRCPDCGVIVSRNGYRCWTCAAEAKRNKSALRLPSKRRTICHCGCLLIHKDEVCPACLVDRLTREEAA